MENGVPVITSMLPSAMIESSTGLTTGCRPEAMAIRSATIQTNRVAVSHRSGVEAR